MAEFKPQVVELKEGIVVDLDNLAKEVETHNMSSNDRLFVRTNIRNRSKNTVFPVESHFWHGGTYFNNPQPLTNQSGVDYPQFGTPPEGIKYGFVYADGDDSLSRKFVVAVHVPLPVGSSGRVGKVYVEAGPIGPIDWNVVEVKLNMATENKAVYDDPIFGARVEAEIRETDGYTFITFRN